VPWQALGQGTALRGVSPVNESMGGASVACPIDSAGALHWNPASISGLAASDMSFGMELILPSSTLSSSVPALGLSGTDRSEPGVTPVPSMAFVRKIEGSPWTYGLSLVGIGGVSVNYPLSTLTGTHNPVLFPQAGQNIPGVGPVPGFGPLSANVDVLQMAPTVACALNERLSVGSAPTLTMARLVANPLFLADRVPNGLTPADGDYPTVYPAGVGTRYIFGGGFQCGLYGTTEGNWSYGVSFKSPQWTEPFRYKSMTSTTHTAEPETIEFRLNYPMIYSIGFAYSGFEKWIIACDLRYFDFANTRGFLHSPPTAGHAVTGLAWNSVPSVAIGVQRQLTECITVRFGYCYNDNPIDSEAVTFNIASPLVVQHVAAAGFSYAFADNWILAATYVHAFENAVTGPLLSYPPGSTVTTAASADAISLGFSKRF